MPIGFDSYLVFLSIVTLIVVSPGVNLALLIQATPKNGRSAGLMMTVGFCAAIMVHASLALIGVGAIIMASAMLFSILKLAGASYLIWLGIKAFAASVRGRPVTAVSPGGTTTLPLDLRRGFLRGFLTNILNPKPAIFYVAAFPQFLDTSGTATWIAGLGLGASHAAIALVFYGGVVLTVERTTDWLRRPAVWRTIQSMTGMLFIFVGARLMFSRAPGG